MLSVNTGHEIHDEVSLRNTHWKDGVGNEISFGDVQV